MRVEYDRDLMVEISARPFDTFAGLHAPPVVGGADAAQPLARGFAVAAARRAGREPGRAVED